MAYVVRRPGDRFELRESRWTQDGPRSRTLVTFRELSTEAIELALARSHGVITKADLVAVARRAGAPVARSRADEAGARLIAALGDGEILDSGIERLIRDRLGQAPSSRDKAVSDAERAAATWLGRSLEERGEALRDLLSMGDRLPVREQRDKPRFPVIRTRTA